MAVDIRNISSLSNLFQHSELNLVSPKGHAYVMFYYYITNKKPNHFTAIYYVS